MEYVNQLEYEALPYPTTLSPDAERPQQPYPTAARAGCGLACLCMLGDALGGEKLTMEKCVKLSVVYGANRDGTDMQKLGPIMAERWNLDYRESSDPEELRQCLGSGGMAILNAGRVHGLFSEGGHFLLAAVERDERIWILDPSYMEEKYAEPHRRDAVEIEYPYVIASLADVVRETQNRSPSYYLFTKQLYETVPK